MKKRLLSALPALGFLALSTPLASCGSNAPHVQSGDTVFLTNPYLDLSDMPERLSFHIDVEGEISQILFGVRTQLYPGDFGYSDGILTIDTGSLLDEEGNPVINSGDTTLRIYADTSVTANVLVVDKVLRTAEDVIALNDYENNPQAIAGSYILGNDIDFSGVTNMQPIGFSDSVDGTHYNHYFNGVFDGNGYTISGVNITWNSDISSNLNVYNNAPYWNDVSHAEGVNYGFFQEIGEAGCVRNVRFSDCSVTGKSIVGIVAGNVSGTVENVIVDAECSVVASTHYYDESCNAAGLVGILGTTGTVNDCVVLTDDISVLSQYTDYDDAYLDEIPADGSEPVNYHIFYGGDKGMVDSNGVTSVGVYGGVGLSYGNTSNSYCLKGGDVSNFTQTHLEANKSKDGPDVGTQVGCAALDDAALKSASTYSDFDATSWVITDGAYPRLKASHPTEVAL